MTGSTATSSDRGLFETRFSIGAAAVSAVSFLLGIAFFVFGYQDSSLPVAGTELHIVTGLVGFMALSFVGVVALVAAFYMEPGFDR